MEKFPSSSVESPPQPPGRSEDTSIQRSPRGDPSESRALPYILEPFPKVMLTLLMPSSLTSMTVRSAQSWVVLPDHRASAPGSEPLPPSASKKNPPSALTSDRLLIFTNKS